MADQPKARWIALRLHMMGNVGVDVLAVLGVPIMVLAMRRKAAFLVTDSRDRKVKIAREVRATIRPVVEVRQISPIQ